MTRRELARHLSKELRSNRSQHLALGSTVWKTEGGAWGAYPGAQAPPTDAVIYDLIGWDRFPERETPERIELTLLRFERRTAGMAPRRRLKAPVKRRPSNPTPNALQATQRGFKYMTCPTCSKRGVHLKPDHTGAMEYRCRECHWFAHQHGNGTDQREVLRLQMANSQNGLTDASPKGKINYDCLDREEFLKLFEPADLTEGQ